MGFATVDPPILVNKTITFTGAAGLGLAGSSIPIFTVTGEVYMVVLIGFCSVDLTEALATATIALLCGTVTLIAATNSLGIDANDLWIDATPTDVDAVAIPAALKEIVISANVTISPATQNTNGGTLRISMLWYPLSEDANVVAA